MWFLTKGHFVWGETHFVYELVWKEFKTCCWLFKVEFEKTFVSAWCLIPINVC